MKKHALSLALVFMASLAQAQTVGEVNLNITDAIHQVFDIPAVSVMSQAFSVGFVPVMTFYLVGYCVGALVNFWNQ